MKDEEKTREQLLTELARMRSRIAKLEDVEEDRKRTVNALRESEERLRSFISHVAQKTRFACLLIRLLYCSR